MRFKILNLAVVFSVVLVAAPTTVVGAPVIYCDNPTARPTRLLQYPLNPPPLYDVASNGKYVFLSDPYGQNAIRRYSLNGAVLATWLLSGTVQWPGEIAMSPDGSLLYVVSDSDDYRVFVFDVNGTGSPTRVLFDEEPDPGPGGHVGGGAALAVHPISGDIYVVDQGYYGEGQEQVWRSRIECFDADGNFKFLIPNNLALMPHETGYDVPNPLPPACGAWHHPWTLLVDGQGNVYLHEFVSTLANMDIVHKFNPAHLCVGTWVTTNKEFRIDRDGYIYTRDYNSSTVTKWNSNFIPPGVYGGGPLQALGPIERVEFVTGSTDFALIVSTNVSNGDRRMEVFGAHIEPLNIIGTPWQDTEPPYQLKTDNLASLITCDPDKKVMAGVVADGVSPLLLRWKVPGPGDVEWSMEDPDVVPPLGDPTEGLGSLANLDASVTDPVSIETPVEQIQGEYFAFAVYTAPKDFDRADAILQIADGGVGERPVRIAGQYRPQSSPNPDLATIADIKVRRPPILMVHGWMGSAQTWEYQAFDADSRFQRHKSNYKETHGQSLDYHLTQGTIAQDVGDTRALEEIQLFVSAQVDAVMHSMGGLHVRKWGSESTYENANNMGKGDFHKLLFLDTPHHGARLANIGTSVRWVITSLLDPASPNAGMAKRQAARYGLEGWITSLAATFEQFTGPALDDMRTDSAELSSLPEFVVPTHAHVGDASAFWSYQNGPFRPVWTAAAPAAVLAWFAELCLKDSEAPTMPSDLIVATESQQGGLGSSYYKTVTALPRSIHTEVTGSSDAEDLIEKWATRRTDDASFFAPSIPAPVLSAPQPGLPSTLEDAYAMTPDFVGRALKVVVTNPPNGADAFPGQNITVRVEEQPAIGFGVGDGDTVFVFYPGGAIVQTFENLTDVNGTTIAVPLDHIGPFNIMAIAKRGDGRLVSSATVPLNVNPGAKTPPATITAIRAEPSLVVLSGRGASELVRVIADYTDGYEREVTGTALGTAYTGGGNALTITSDGVMVGVTAGSVTVHVTNGTYFVDIPVTVLNGPQINNAPHAYAGGPYAACDSQFVYLDGAVSYDLDEVLGDVLTYAWDLDADGQFDDAAGATPFVQLVFPGAYWLLGLKVTDSQGLESVDYAFLEAGVGCLDGDFVCAVSRAEAVEAFAGIDAAGNVYVAEHNITEPLFDRIVKFSPSCDSVATFPLSERPNQIVVTADGTSYVPDDFPDGVWKYTSSGAESFVPLAFNPAHIAVDASGNIYSSDNSASGLVRKLSSTGSPITTWNVAQDVGGSFPIWDIAVSSGEAIYAASGDRIARGVLQNGVYALDWVQGQTGVDVGSFDVIQGIAVGPSGDLYVSDRDNHRIQRFRSDGTFVRLWMGSGKTNDGALRLPASIAIGASGQVVVVDEPFGFPPRVQVFGTDHAIVNAEIAALARVNGELHPHPATAVAACPQGDGDELVITVALDPTTVAGPVSASSFAVTMPSDDDAFLYVAEDADSDATLINGKYRTTITLRQFGGCVAGDLIVKLNGTGIGATAIDMRSPDLLTTPVSYGKVNLQDFSDLIVGFPVHFQSPPKPYWSCVDYRPVAGEVKLPDFTYFGEHFNHYTGGAGLRAGEILTTDATLRLELEETNPVAGERRLWARLVVENVEPFKALVVSLRSDHPMLEYLGWHPNSTYPEATLCTEVMRDGLKQVFLGVMGAGKPMGSVLELGRIEFSVRSGGQLTLGEEDLAFVLADLLAVDGKVRAFSGLRFQKTYTSPTYRFELAQNYPNPFNPTTTISFSLADPLKVTLSIFDVRGSLVKTLVSGTRDAGVHRTTWDATDNRGVRVSSGVYFYRLTAGSFRDTKKMVLLR